MTTRPRARIELICVGSELLSGRINTHQSYLSIKLLSAGLSIARESSLPDVRSEIAAEVAAALKRCDALLLCGGLGPTFDDLTRESVADALKRTLFYKPRIWAGIKNKFFRYRMSVPEENKRQAYLIEGARAIDNAFGSAPGQMILLPRRGRPAQVIALMPGPFKEMAPMFESTILPRLARDYARGIFMESMSLHLSGIPESEADEKLAPVLALADDGLEFTILASAGQVDFYARVRADSRAAAKRRIAEVKNLCYQSLERHIFGENKDSLEAVVGRKLAEKGLTLALAESCTGGMIGQRITAVAGSSAYFKGGAIAYANDLKEKYLGVRPDTIARHGAVSAECAEEMAQGARAAAGAKVGLSITGIAGPSGGTKEKPVGLVYVAIAGPGNGTVHFRLMIAGDRETIRERAAATALYLLNRRLS